MSFFGSASGSGSLVGVIAVAGLLGGCAPEYPAPPTSDRDDVVDTIHGHAISDPYRWLEDQDSARTRAWIDAQNAYGELILGETPHRDRVRSRLGELFDVDEVGAPRKGGEYEYFMLRRVGEERAAIYRRQAPREGELVRIDPAAEHELVVDPADVSALLTTSIDLLSVSPDGKLVLYSVRDGGGDEIEVRVRDAEADADLEDRLPPALYGSVAFTEKGDGFYYVRRSRESGPRVRLHRLLTNIEVDALLFGEGYGPRSFINVEAIMEGELLVLTVRHGWARSEIYVQDTEEPERTRALTENDDARFYPHASGHRLFVRTNLDAPNNRILAITLSESAHGSWQEVIPEREDVLHDLAIIDDKLYVTYLHDVSSEIVVFDEHGSEKGEVSLPPHHSASIRPAAPGKAFLTLESFLQPEVTYLLDLETGTRELWSETEMAFDAEGYVVEQVRYRSKDGTSVPMYLVHAENLSPTGAVPTLLHGYGGFNVAQTPRFDAMAAVWIEHGGLFALANLRGGSEYGERWHRAGMLDNKQNVFDDFIAAAEWLVESGYTRPERLAIRGSSNGGLLVAAALTQRPELFRAVLCGFPDLDMVRFYTFTDTNNMPALLEYGDAEKPEHFEFLRRYSPYQAVREGVPYPAVMITSGDLDTRVPPLQARKMAARLQGASSSGLPVILRYHPKAGHAANRGLPLSERIEDLAAELTFLLTQVDVLPETADGDS